MVRRNLPKYVSKFGTKGYLYFRKDGALHRMPDDPASAEFAQDYPPHSLRHAAASEIAAIPGMTEEHVKAITGHTSSQMVRLYAGPAGQKARAIEAQRGRK